MCTIQYTSMYKMYPKLLLRIVSRCYYCYSLYVFAFRLLLMLLLLSLLLLLFVVYVFCESHRTTTVLSAGYIVNIVFIKEQNITEQKDKDVSMMLMMNGKPSLFVGHQNIFREMFYIEMYF